MQGSKSQDLSSGRRRHWVRTGALASGGLLLSLASGASCGGTAGNGGILIQSNTNWLQRCGPEAPCAGALLCLCGMCSQPCAESVECGRLEGASCGGGCGEAAAAGGGMCVLGCVTDADCGEGFACEAAECRPQPGLPGGSGGDPGAGPVGVAGSCATTFVSLDRMFEQARRDLEGLDTEARPFTRYLSLANRHDAGACDAELELERLALAKTLNSTSGEPTLGVPVAVDADELLYRIDLREYGWHSARTLTGRAYADAWELLVASTPFGVAFDGPDAGALAVSTRTAVPLIQADALVYAASRAEVYRALLDQPATLTELLVELGVDPTARRADGGAKRAGTTRSLISRADRILERLDLGTRAGVLWLTLDFQAAPGTSIFDDPLARESDGGTLLYSLPNGLPAFAIHDADGGLRPDSDILLDTNQRDFKVRAAVSCMNCHTDTILPVADEVASQVATDLAGYSAEERRNIELLYPGTEALREQMASDNESFRRALEQLGVPRGNVEPVSSVALRFDLDLTPQERAGDLMLAPGEHAELRAALELEGNVPRELFAQRWAEQLCTSLAGARNQPVSCRAR